MEQLYVSQYSSMTFEAIHSLTIFRWLPASRLLTPEAYQAEMMRYIQGIERVQSKRLLADLQDFSFVIDVHLQAWSDTEVAGRAYRAGLREIAFVISKDFITQFAVEQTMDEVEGRKFHTMYFHHEQEARNWLLLDAHYDNIFCKNQ